MKEEAEALRKILNELPLDTPITSDEMKDKIQSITGHKPNSREFWKIMKEVRKEYDDIISGSWGYQRTKNSNKRLRSNNKIKRHIKREESKILKWK